MRWIAAAAVGIATMIAGCRKPYQAEATLIGDARYMIRSAPEGEQRSESIATQAAHRRAKELCPDGYEVIDRKTDVARSTERVAVFGRRTNETPEVTLTVRCTTPPER